MPVRAEGIDNNVPYLMGRVFGGPATKAKEMLVAGWQYKTGNDALWIPYRQKQNNNIDLPEKFGE